MAERVNDSQIKYIFDYMRRNKYVLRVMCVGRKAENIFKIKWAQLAKELNSLGPPVKTVVQWQKVWKYLQNIAIMKTLKNRSRRMAKKLSSFIPQSMISPGQDVISTIEKKQFSVVTRSVTKNFCLPVSRIAHRSEHGMPIEWSSSDSSSIPNLVGRKNLKAVKEMKKLPGLSSFQEDKYIIKKSTIALQSFSFNLNSLPECL